VTATLTIGPNERDTLHWLMCRRLFILGQDPPGLACKEGVSTDELAEEFSEDLRLMEDLGWEAERGSAAVELTMPADSLTRTLKRLRRDTRRAPHEEPHELEPKDSNPERWERFRQAVDVCEELLDLLDSPHRQQNRGSVGAPCPLAVAGEGLKPYTPVPDGLIMAAIARGECHERSPEVWVLVVAEHLGFEPTAKTIAALHPRLEDLRRGGWLSRSEKQDREHWSLTAAGREELTKRREKGTVRELPESLQHRAWRKARMASALRIDGFKGDMGEALEAADDVLTRYGEPASAVWFSLAERLSAAAWRLGSANHCLYEWMEPEDGEPDVDEWPGPAPGRRTTSAWDQNDTES
jgi:hypothetical protein